MPKWRNFTKSGHSDAEAAEAGAIIQRQTSVTIFSVILFIKLFGLKKIQWKNGWTRPVSACVLDAELYATTMQFIFTHSEGQGKLLNCNKLVRPQKTMNKTVHLTFSSNVKSRNIRNETALKVQHSRNKFHV